MAPVLRSGRPTPAMTDRVLGRGSTAAPGVRDPGRFHSDSTSRAAIDP
jgi:hypothetical protein